MKVYCGFFFEQPDLSPFLVGGDSYDPELAETAGLPAESAGGEGGEGRRRRDGEEKRRDDGSSSPPSADIFWEPAFTLSADRRPS